MKKREFIKTVTAAAASMPFLAFSTPEWLKELEGIQGEALTENEAFWEKVRSDYDLNPDYINLESGYYNIIPKTTLDRLTEHIKRVNFEGAHYMRTVQWENKARMVVKLADVVSCDPKNLILTRNTTESLDMIIKGFPWEKGDDAVYAIQDYGAMQNMFEQVSDRYGINLIKVSVPNHPKNDEEIVELYANAITDNTKLLMVCHMINITGQILPVRKICDMAHGKGVQVMVDGAHCIGHFQVRIDELHCDYYGSSLHKWLAVPLGTGMLYVADERIDSIWPLLAEEEREPGDISRLNHTGTHPVYHDLTVENAIDYYNMLGGKRKEDRLRYLQRYWTDRVRDHKRIIVNTPVESHRSCGIANVGIEGIKPGILAQRLFEEYGIFTVAIDYANVHGCRITPNVFNSTDEIETLINALETMAGE